MPVKISPPWISYARKLNALFGRDPNVIVIYDDEGPEVKLYVGGADKAEAIGRILPQEVSFGGVTLKVTVVPDNDEYVTMEETFRRAFAGNPVVDSVSTAGMDSAVTGRCFVSFVPEVAQFFNDDITSPEGVTTTTLEDIASEVLQVDGVSFCTTWAEPHEYWP